MKRLLSIYLFLFAGCTPDGSVTTPVASTSREVSTASTTATGTAEKSVAKQTEPPDPAAVARVAAAGNMFACDAYARLREAKGGIFFSPYSIHTALAMTLAGARGQTADEMSAVLHLGSTDESLDSESVHGAVAALAESVRAGSARDGDQLKIANRLWGQARVGFRPEFLTLTRDRYGAELAQVDFAMHTEQARQSINIWVEDQTEKKIRELLKPGMVNELTKLVLTNAIYFKGQWKSRFDKKLTADAPFHVSAGETVKVSMMNLTESFRYHAAEGVRIMEFPYRNGGLSMIVLLPEKLDGLADIEGMLSSDHLDRWTSALHATRAIVALPRLTMTAEFKLAGVLSALGMASAFVPLEADFSGMTGDRELYIGDVIHKAFVDVNEEGTEAAAATAVIMATPGPLTENKTIVFRVDHPFLFLIRNAKTGSILFLGRVLNPKS